MDEAKEMASLVILCLIFGSPLGSESNPYPDQTPPKIAFTKLTDSATLVRLEQPIDIEASDPPMKVRKGRPK